MAEHGFHQIFFYDSNNDVIINRSAIVDSVPESAANVLIGTGRDKATYIKTHANADIARFDDADKRTTLSGQLTLAPMPFADLGSPPDFTIAACSDCVRGAPICTTGGTGSIAQRIGGVWRCD